MLVVDANVVVGACLGPRGFDRFAGRRLVAPPLMWSEARSTLHEAAWRNEIPLEDARETHDRLEHAPVERREHDELGPEALRIAEELGWAKTYDAEYVALARLLGCRLVTLDARLHRGAARLGLVVAPSEV